jgi:hypothetical protein
MSVPAARENSIEICSLSLLPLQAQLSSYAAEASGVSTLAQSLSTGRER